MHVVFVVPDLSGHSGWSRYAADMGAALAKEGHRVSALVERKTEAPWCHQQYAVLRSATAYLGTTLLSRWTAWRMNRALRALRPDVVHVIAEPYALPLTLIRTPTWRSVMTFHGTYAVAPFRRSPAIRQLFGRVCERMNTLIAVSHFTKNFLQQSEPEIFECIGGADKIHIIHNAIQLPPPLTQWTPSTDQLRKILSVSAIKRKKGYMEALDAVALYHKQHPGTLQYRIVGNDKSDPAFTQELKERIQTLGLEDVVELMGSVDDTMLSTLYAQADLFLLLSLQDGVYVEGFGLVFLEANAHGVPVIGPTTGGCPEAIKEGVSGYVCEPNDAADVARKMQEILLKRRIQRNACRAWAEAHNVADAAREIIELYRA